MATAVDNTSSQDIAELMILSKQIRTHSIALTALRARRKELIRSLYRQGMSERQIALKAGLSGAYVNEVRHER